MGQDCALDLTVFIFGRVDLDEADLGVRISQGIMDEVSGDACVSEGGHC
jgi:hypothetical protein